MASSVYDRSGSGLGLANFLMLQAYEQGNKKENERCTPRQQEALALSDELIAELQNTDP